MKLYRICDNDKTIARQVFEGKIEKGVVNVQGYNKPIEITSSDIVLNISIDNNAVLDKPICFRVNHAVHYEKGRSTLFSGLTDDMLDYSYNNNEYVDCKHKDSQLKARYNDLTREYDIIFDGLLYIA